MGHASHDPIQASLAVVGAVKGGSAGGLLSELAVSEEDIVAKGEGA